jgi:hypothetical protein
VHKITIMSRGQALGYTMVLPDEDKYSTTRNEMLDQLAYLLGGRAAEEIVFHDPTTGASNDIEKATSVARAMVTQYGMTERLGAIKFGSDGSEPFLGRDFGSQRNYSEEIAAAVDEEVGKLILNAHQEAFDILVENRAVLDHLVEELLEKETLDKNEIARVFTPVVQRERRPAWTGSSTRVPSDQPPVMPIPTRAEQNGSLSDVLPGGSVGPDENIKPPNYGGGPTPPSNTSLPTVSGSAQEGQTLTASAGNWSGSAPISYAYRWQRCSPGCLDIAGASGNSYLVAAADIGATLRAVVTASNSAGSSEAASAQTALVIATGETTVTISAGVGADDGDVSVVGNQPGGYPPTGTPAANSTNTVFTAGRRLAFGQYRVITALVRFDTSSLPDNATITSAKLRLSVTGKADGDDRSLVGECKCLIDPSEGANCGPEVRRVRGEPPGVLRAAKLGVRRSENGLDASRVSRSGLDRRRGSHPPGC